MVCLISEHIKFFFDVRYWTPIRTGSNSEGRYEKNLHEDLRTELAIWRLVFERLATLNALETSWSLDDVYRANALLDMKDDLAEEEKRRMKK